MESRHVISADFDALEFMPNFFTTAVPTSLTSELLDNLGYPKKCVIRIRVTSLNYRIAKRFKKNLFKSGGQFLDKTSIISKNVMLNIIKELVVI
jgi:hypothetical protein